MGVSLLLLFKNINKIFKEKNNLILNLFLLGLLGFILLLAGNIFTGDANEVKNIDKQAKKEEVKRDNYVKSLSIELEDTLSRIKGVSEVKVQLMTEEGNTYIYEYNENNINKITNETDQNGGEREIKEDNQETKLVVVKDVSGNEKPVIKVEKRPEIMGAIIVAGGAEISKIKYEIYKTVSSFLNLPLHKINVLPYDSL